MAVRQDIRICALRGSVCGTAAIFSWLTFLTVIICQSVFLSDVWLGHRTVFTAGPRLDGYPVVIISLRLGFNTLLRGAAGLIVNIEKGTPIGRFSDLPGFGIQTLLTAGGL
ncbi:hypothetical protein [Pelotomaculum propionicicum]|uniref:hypothetical protein n=1 Tax=Pelotomaculum propionicicum TaxID=258475 RepID=UPI00106566D6|nr:hypothetical protein [Pelotomaculum propionicicum]NLI13081.1 hypothetical protein [Peptococcaceae bacterium]